MKKDDGYDDANDIKITLHAVLALSFYFSS